MACFSFGLYLKLAVQMYWLTSSNVDLKTEVVSVLSIHLSFLVTYSVQIFTVQTLYHALGFNGEQNRDSYSHNKIVR